MNLFDVLFMAKTGTVKPGASMFDILFAQKLRGAAGKIVTILGNPLSFVTKKAQMAISTKISMEPIQEGSGDPSPTNIRPISGRTGVEIDGCGKNLIPSGTDTTKGYMNNNLMQVNGNPSTNNDYYVSQYFSIRPNTKYRYSTNNPNATSPSIAFYDKNKNFISGVNILVARSTTITTPSNAYYARASQGKDDTRLFQFELGEIITPYEPYAESNEITISFGETVYGGTLDVEKGELTVDKGYVDLGSLNWSYSSLGGGRVYASKSDMKNSADSLAHNDIFSDYYRDSDWSSINFCIHRFNNMIRVRDTNILSDMTPAQIQEVLNGKHACYPLKVPTTISLTPEQVQLLKGHNTIWTDGDVIELTYDKVN